MIKDLVPRLPLVHLEDWHCYVQDCFLKEVAENSVLHVTVKGAQAWYERFVILQASNLDQILRFAGPSTQQPGTSASVQRPRLSTPETSLRHHARAFGL